MRIVWRILAQDDNFFWLPQNSSGADSSHSAELRSWSGQAENATLLGMTELGGNAIPIHNDYKIFLPKADIASSTARLAVRLCSSITGLTSTTSKLSIRPWSAMISMAR